MKLTTITNVSVDGVMQGLGPPPGRGDPVPRTAVRVSPARSVRFSAFLEVSD
jgi:hypothetical protein